MHQNTQRAFETVFATTDNHSFPLIPNCKLESPSFVRLPKNHRVEHLLVDLYQKDKDLPMHQHFLDLRQWEYRLLWQYHCFGRNHALLLIVCASDIEESKKWQCHYNELNRVMIKL